MKKASQKCLLLLFNLLVVFPSLFNKRGVVLDPRINLLKMYVLCMYEYVYTHIPTHTCILGWAPRVEE